ncbi:MAG: hypothetical protein HY940_08165 [Gammaproteobacteria bacterium]|nr:hypothetical protein [Gammaproteobacteria bacterium]
MTLYSVEKLIAEARKVAADYRRATGKPLPGVSAEICMHDAARLLDLELTNNPALGYDAMGRGGVRAGKKIQIKGRAIFDESKGGHRLGQLKTEQDWDSVMLVLMDDNLEPVEIYEAQRNDLLNDLDQTSHSRRNKRGAMSVGRFKALGLRVWTRELGVDADGVWDNQTGR